MTDGDFRTYLEKKKGWWVETKATVPCILPLDGLLAVFKLKDVESVLDAHYPTGKGDWGQKVWFFNKTKDREIAESDGDRVVCNPQVLTSHFMEKKS